MARADDDERIAVFFHEAADSEELCEEALRCQASIVSSDLYPAFLASFQQVMQTLSGWLRSSAVAIWMHTCTVLVAPFLAAPKARVARRLVLASILNRASLST